MSKAKQATATSPDKKTQSGYNEKNPGQSQGAFKADSMNTESPGVEKRVKGPGLKKQYSKK
jgi:hypothetical protein